MSDNKMKKCPFCAEEIKVEAMKCRYCGEFLTAVTTKTPWYFKTSMLVSLFMLVGPLALPLLWKNPLYSKRSKILWTILIVLLSYVLISGAIEAFKNLSLYYGEFFKTLEIY